MAPLPQRVTDALADNSQVHACAQQRWTGPDDFRPGDALLDPPPACWSPTTTANPELDLRYSLERDNEVSTSEQRAVQLNERLRRPKQLGAEDVRVDDDDRRPSGRHPGSGSDGEQELGFLVIGEVVEYRSLCGLPRLGACKLLLDWELAMFTGSAGFRVVR